MYISKESHEKITEDRNHQENVARLWKAHWKEEQRKLHAEQEQNENYSHFKNTKTHKKY